MSDVIERTGKLKLDVDPYQLVEQPESSQKSLPKWLTKALESVHRDEVGKIGTKISTKQDGGDVYNSI